jgi:hypothetical protein
VGVAKPWDISRMLLADMIFPAAFFPYVMGIVALPVILFALACEVFAIWLFARKCGSAFRIILQVLIANIISAVAGLFVVLPLFPAGLSTRDGAEVTAQSWSQIAAWSFLAYFAASVLIEGAYYRYVSWPIRISRPYIASFIGNTVSYAILAIAWLPKYGG